MSKADRRRERREAAHAEQARRWRVAEASAPLSRTMLAALVDHVSERIVTSGHDESFRSTLEWLALNQVSEQPVLAFFKAHRIAGDFGVATEGDPWHLFGPTADRLARMPLDRPDLEALLASLEDEVSVHGCDHSTTLTERWLQDRGLPVSSTIMALLALGGGCDCEVTMNVEVPKIYPSPPVGVA